MSEAVGEAMVQINGRVPLSLRKRLKVLAIQHDTSLERELEQAVRLYLEQEWAREDEAVS